VYLFILPSHPGLERDFSDEIEDPHWAGWSWTTKHYDPFKSPS